jgi:hypothetical protein
MGKINKRGKSCIEADVNKGVKVLLKGKSYLRREVSEAEK